MIQLTESKTKRVHSFLDYISSGTKLHCTFAIDFTGMIFPSDKSLDSSNATIIVENRFERRSSSSVQFTSHWAGSYAIRARNESHRRRHSGIATLIRVRHYIITIFRVCFFIELSRITPVKCFPCSISGRARLQFHTNCTSAVLTAWLTLTDLACTRFNWARRDALVLRLSTSPAQPRNVWNGVGSIARTTFYWLF